MKVVFAISLIVTVATSSVSAFAPSAPFVSRASQTRTTEIYSDPKEEEGLDLDLEEMFDM